MSTLLARPAPSLAHATPSRLPAMNARGGGGKDPKRAPARDRGGRAVKAAGGSGDGDASNGGGGGGGGGDPLARRKLESLRRRSAHTRQRNGTINAAERLRLAEAERQLGRLQRRAAANIARYQRRLRQELHEMEASRRALRKHSVTEVSTEERTDMAGLARFAARGRYLYSVRSETKSEREEMEAYNGRLERADRLLQPARRQSLAALDSGKDMGSNPAHVYTELGRRISLARLDSVLEDVETEDGDARSEDGGTVVGPALRREPTDRKRTPRGLPTATTTIAASSSFSSAAATAPPSPPPFDMTKLRSELGPDLQKELDDLEMDEMGRGLTPLFPAGPTADGPAARSDGGPQRRERAEPQTVHAAPAAEGETKRSRSQSQQQARLKLPPVQVNRHFVLGKASGQQLLASLARPTLSTVTENKAETAVTLDA